jgi:hypothetical protein
MSTADYVLMKALCGTGKMLHCKSVSFILLDFDAIICAIYAFSDTTKDAFLALVNQSIDEHNNKVKKRQPQRRRQNQEQLHVSNDILVGFDLLRVPNMILFAF